MDFIAPGVEYQYGPRLMGDVMGGDKIGPIIKKLRDKPDTRSAYASLWDPYTDFDIEASPCLTSVHAMVRDNKLQLFCTIRSNDMYRAWPFNAAALGWLQEKIAHGLGLRKGQLSILSTSAHIYEDNWIASMNAVEEMRVEPFTQDPRGNIVLRWDDGLGYADIYSPDVRVLLTLNGSSEASLSRAVKPHISRVDHALYIGREIHRLFYQGAGYVQDRVG